MISEGDPMKIGNVSKKVNLRKGDLLISATNPEIVGILLHRKGKYWHYMLTSDGILEHNRGIRVSSVQKETRDSILRGYSKGFVNIYRKGKLL